MKKSFIISILILIIFLLGFYSYLLNTERNQVRVMNEELQEIILKQADTSIVLQKLKDYHIIIKEMKVDLRKKDSIITSLKENIPR